MVFLMLLVVARIVVWVMRMEEIVQNEHYFHQDLIEFFKHQLKIIESNWFWQILVKGITSLVCVNWAKTRFAFLAPSSHNGANPTLG